jgi:hypothetical protein
MNPAKWDTSTDPDRMLDAADGRLSDRKLLLFGCACARRVWGLLPESVRATVPLVEGAAEVPDEEDRHEALRKVLFESVGHLAGLAVYLLQPRLQLGQYIPFVARVLREREWNADLPLEEQAWTEYLSPLLNTSPRRDHPEQAALLRCIAGYPMDPPTFDPLWRTSDALSLAEGIYAEEAFDRLPILADALMDAGCCDDRILSHLRAAGPHVRGCWVVDLVLGKA